MGRAAPAGGCTGGAARRPPPGYETSPSSIARSCAAVWTPAAKGSAAEGRAAPAAALPTPGGPGHAGRGLGARALTWREAEQRQQQRGQPGSARGQVPLHSCSVPLGGQSQRRRRRGGAKPPLSAATRRKASIASRWGTACLLTSSPQTSRDAGRARPRLGGHGQDPPPAPPQALGIHGRWHPEHPGPLGPNCFPGGGSTAARGGGASQTPLG